jgi:T-complex protein 1 subunit zeta
MLAGDGTTSAVLFVGELLKYAERHIGEVGIYAFTPSLFFSGRSSKSQGVHPRVLADGFELAKERSLKTLDALRVQKTNAIEDRELLVSVARTSLRTKLEQEVCHVMCP